MASKEGGGKDNVVKPGSGASSWKRQQTVKKVRFSANSEKTPYGDEAIARPEDNSTTPALVGSHMGGVDGTRRSESEVVATIEGHSKVQGKKEQNEKGWAPVCSLKDSSRERKKRKNS